MTTSPRIIKTVLLKNAQTLEIWDLSRKISEDAYVVRMKAQMEIQIKKNLFEKISLSDFKFQDILNTLGDRVIYTYHAERNFILTPEKDGVLDGLIAAFLENLGPYISTPGFPGKFILKEYQNRIR